MARRASGRSLDDFRYEWERNRFDIYTVSNIYVGHDCGWIAVDKNNFHAFFSKRAAGLCTSVVKLCSLSDDNRTRANDENFFTSLFIIFELLHGLRKFSKEIEVILRSG